MKVEELRRGIAHLPSDADIIVNWMTRKEVEDWYNDGIELTNTQWDLLLDEVDMNGDEIFQALEYIKKYVKADDENPI
jgi:predicted nucleotidyltransferase